MVLAKHCGILTDSKEQYHVMLKVLEWFLLLALSFLDFTEQSFLWLLYRFQQSLCIGQRILVADHLLVDLELWLMLATAARLPIIQSPIWLTIPLFLLTLPWRLFLCTLTALFLVAKTNRTLWCCPYHKCRVYIFSQSRVFVARFLRQLALLNLNRELWLRLIQNFVTPLLVDEVVVLVIRAHFCHLLFKSLFWLFYNGIALLIFLIVFCLVRYRLDYVLLLLFIPLIVTCRSKESLVEHV